MPIDPNEPGLADLEDVPWSDEIDGVVSPEKEHANGHLRVAEDWRGMLKTATNPRTKRQYVKPLPVNVARILRYHPQWRGVVAFDEFAERTLATRVPPWHPADLPSACGAGPWTDEDTNRTVNWLAVSEDLEVSAKHVEAALSVVSNANRIHPVRDYLRAVKWDGTQRLPSLLSRYFGGDDNYYTREVGKRWMISAVARAMRPGCQVDCTLLFIGPQGFGKSSGVRALVPQAGWYSETGITIGDKDSYQSLHGIWIYLLDELASLSKVDLAKHKNFLTSPKDHYRESYGRRSRDFPRQNVFCATTNEETPLIDRTGNRRFWPHDVRRAVDVDAIALDRDQLWAEALARFESGEKWHVDSAELREACERVQEEHVEPDDWQQPISEWLRAPKTQAAFPDGVTTFDVLVGAIDMSREDIGRAATIRCGQVLRDLKWMPEGQRRNEHGERERRYVKTAHQKEANP